MKVVSVVGMTGSGKSEVAGVFQKHGFICVRFGDITDAEIARREWTLNEVNERRIREMLRSEHGMSAYAKLNIPRIDATLKKANVVADGLYSWEEYLLFREYYGENYITVAVYTAPVTRYRRLSARSVRGLTHDEAASRDIAEIENLNKGGPIAMADYTIINDNSLEEVTKQVEKIIEKLQ